VCRMGVGELAGSDGMGEKRRRGPCRPDVGEEVVSAPFEFGAAAARCDPYPHINSEKKGLSSSELGTVSTVVSSFGKGPWWDKPGQGGAWWGFGRKRVEGRELDSD